MPRGVKQWIEYQGDVDTLSGWARRVGMTPSLLRERLKKMDLASALAKDVKIIGECGEYISAHIYLTTALHEGIVRYARERGVLSQSLAIRELLTDALTRQGIVVETEGGHHA